MSIDQKNMIRSDRSEAHSTRSIKLQAVNAIAKNSRARDVLAFGLLMKTKKAINRIESDGKRCE